MKSKQVRQERRKEERKEEREEERKERGMVSRNKGSEDEQGAMSTVAMTTAAPTADRQVRWGKKTIAT